MVKEQRIIARIIIEILGAPKEHVEETMKLVLDKVKEQTYLRLLKEKIFETKQIKKFWSTFAEIEISVENISNLMGFCFDFMPSSIEILEPESIEIGSGEVADLLNDLLARLHKYDMALKNLRAHYMIMQKELEKKKKE